MADMDFYESSDKKGSKSEAEIEAYREEVRMLIEHIVKLLVDSPEEVTVTTYLGPKTTVFRISCAMKDVGQVIGSQGKTIMGLRSVVHAMTARLGVRSIVELPV